MTVETPHSGGDHGPPPSQPHIGARLFGARLTLFWEQLWPGLLSALTLAGIFLSLALFDVLPLLPVWLHGLALVLTGGGLLWLVWRGVRHVSIADIDAARRRIELDSDLAHRPLQAVSDHMGTGGDDDGSDDSDDDDDDLDDDTE